MLTTDDEQKAITITHLEHYVLRWANKGTMMVLYCSPDSIELWTRRSAKPSLETNKRNEHRPLVAIIFNWIGIIWTILVEGHLRNLKVLNCFQIGLYFWSRWFLHFSIYKHKKDKPNWLCFWIDHNNLNSLS